MELVKIKITAGQGVGQIVSVVPNVARARIAGGTAVLIEDPNQPRPETTALAQTQRGSQREKRTASRKS